VAENLTEQSVAVVRQRMPSRRFDGAAWNSALALVSAFALVCALEWSIGALGRLGGSSLRTLVGPAATRTAPPESLRPAVRLSPSR